MYDTVEVLTRPAKLLVSFYVLAVLFGAPLWTEIKATALLSLVLCILAGAPLLAVYSNDNQLLNLLLSVKYKKLSEKLAFGAAVGSVVGCYLGAFVIPLDWDRWWQRYPIPNLYGAVGGFFAGIVLALLSEHPLNNGEAVENGLHENGVTEVPEEAPVVERAHSPDADLPEISTSTATTPTPTITPSSSSGSISNPSSYGEDIFGKFKHTDVPKLQSIFFAFFDNDLGSQILYQVPPTTATVIQRFPIYANVILPKDELLNRLVKINFGDCKIISHPVGLTSESDHVGYERGVLLFNMCFVVCEDSRADCMYEPIVQKIAEYLTELEQESWFISEPSTRARLPAIMESIFEQINAKGECVLPIDGTMTRIYLKMCPSYRGHEPPKVALYMVPMLTRNVEMTAELVSKMDVLSQKIIPKIDGVRCVKEIACEVDIDADLVSRCIRNLFFYECVSLVPLFLYQNTYVSTEKLHDFYQNPAKIQECIEFVRLQKPDEERGPLPLFSDVFRLYLSLTCGYTMDRWCQEMKPQRYNVDERRLVQFGMYYRFVRKLSVYPVTTVTSEANRSQRIFKLCDGTKALEDLAVLYSTPPSDMYHFLKQSGKFEFISK